MLSKILVASVALSLFSTVAKADDHRPANRTPQRFDRPVSNDSDRNRDLRNQRIASYRRLEGSRNSGRYYRGGRSYYYGSGYYGSGFYGGGYYGFGYPYYGQPTLAINLDSDYVGEYREDDRPIYRGRQVTEGHSVSLEVSVQKKLASLGYYRGSLDGDIGPASRKAISRYQHDNDLAETGRIDRSLVEALGLS